MLFATRTQIQALGDLAARALTIPETQNLRKRFLEPAIEWLVDGKYAVRRLAAVLILKTLATLTPSLFFEVHHQLPKGFGTKAECAKQKVDQAFIWGAILDREKVEIRVHGAEAFGAFITQVHERESEDEYYAEAIAEVDRNLDRAAAEGSGKGKPEIIHAALLVLIQLLKNPGSFMTREQSYPKAKFSKHVKCVLAHRLHRDEHVRFTILELIPMLASFNISWFTQARVDADAGLTQVDSFLYYCIIFVQ